MFWKAVQNENVVSPGWWMVGWWVVVGFCFILLERSKDGVGLFVKQFDDDDDGRKFLIELLHVWAGPFFFFLKNMARFQQSTEHGSFLKRNQLKKNDLETACNLDL